MLREDARFSNVLVTLLCHTHISSKHISSVEKKITSHTHKAHIAHFKKWYLDFSMLFAILFWVFK